MTTLNYIDNLGIAYHQIVRIDHHFEKSLSINYQNNSTKQLSQVDELKQFEETMDAYNKLSLFTAASQSLFTGMNQDQSKIDEVKKAYEVLLKNRYVPKLAQE